MSGLFPPNIDDQIGCVEREIAMRLRVYPRRVDAHQMSQETASREVDTMREVLRTLLKVKRGG